MRIAVCLPQVPFEHGGAELFAETLVRELAERDHEATLVTVPFKWYPGTRVLTQAFTWRLLDLEESNGRPIDLVVGTKFPSYCIRHPNKLIWLVHQFRQAYDFDRTELGQFSESPEDRATIEAIRRMDEVAFGEAKAVFAISQNVAGRLLNSTDVTAEVMPPPRHRRSTIASTRSATSCSRSGALIVPNALVSCLRPRNRAVSRL